jgi:hypothetical protein
LIYLAGWLYRLQHPVDNTERGLIQELRERQAKKNTNAVHELYGDFLEALLHAKKAEMEGLL